MVRFGQFIICLRQQVTYSNIICVFNASGSCFSHTATNGHAQNNKWYKCSPTKDYATRETVFCRTERKTGQRLFSAWCTSCLLYTRPSCNTSRRQLDNIKYTLENWVWKCQPMATVEWSSSTNVRVCFTVWARELLNKDPAAAPESFQSFVHI
jgi:hypothetical protein